MIMDDPFPFRCTKCTTLIKQLKIERMMLSDLRGIIMEKDDEIERLMSIINEMNKMRTYGPFEDVRRVVDTYTVPTC